MVKCRCAMCGVKNSKSNRCNLYRFIGTSERISNKKLDRRRLRRSAKINRLINAQRELI